MKILHIILSLTSGGAENLVYNFSVEMNERGHLTDVLVLCDHKDIYTSRLIDHGVNVISLNFNIRERYNPLIAIKVARIMQTYNLVHVHLFPTNYIVALASLFLKNKPKILFTEHNTNNRRREFALLKLVDKAVYKSFDQIVGISEGTIDNLLKWIGNSYSTKLIYNGIPISKYQNALPYSKQQFDLDPQNQVILMVGRFSHSKDQKTLIRSLSYLNNNVRVLFVGDGVLKDECIQLTKALNLQNRVSFLGVRTDVERLIKTSDLCVISSHWEGFGLVAVEYMAGGKPVIASNVDGIREVVDGAGILFDQGNEIALAKSIESILDDRCLYEKVVERCTHRASLFDISKAVDSYIALYKELVA